MYNSLIRIRAVLLFFVFLLIFTAMSNINVSAVSIDTISSIHADSGTKQAGDKILFSIWVYTGYDPVPAGSFTITDTNTSEVMIGNIINGFAQIEWVVSDPLLLGKHIFQINYEGFLNYSPSTGFCIVFFDNFFTGVVRDSWITLGTNSSVVFKKATLEFSGELTIDFGWMGGGYIYIKALNLTGIPTIHTIGPLPNYFSGGAQIIWPFTFNYQVPIFTPVGLNYFLVEYTGTSIGDIKPSQSSLHNVTVMSLGVWLVQTSSSLQLERCQDTLILQNTILGDSPIGMQLESYYFIGSEKIVFYQEILTKRNTSSTFSPNSSIPVGPLAIITELKAISTSDIYANSTQFLMITDKARITSTVNATEFKNNETIRFEVYCTEEDVWTHPVLCTLELIDLTDGNRSISNKSTNQDGFLFFEYSILYNSSIGTHRYGFRSFGSPSGIIDTLSSIDILIKGLTEIDITYESGPLDRNCNTVIEVIVLSEGNPVSSGEVSFEYAINSTVIENKIYTPGIFFEYHIKSSHPLGVMNFQIRFHDSNYYDEHLESFELTIFSSPTFPIVGQNASTLIKGQTVRFYGELADEEGHPVQYQSIMITDNTIGIDLGICSTDSSGLFHLDYYISHSTQIGVHLIEISFQGDLSSFYKPAINSPIISISVRPPLSIMIPSEVIARSFTLITLEGGLNDIIDLHWQPFGSASWNYITSVLLNGSGQGLYNWSTPYYKGDFSIRAIGPNTTKYDFSTMFVIPIIDFIGNSTANVNEIYAFAINSSERYQIWIADQLWQDWREGGIHLYEYIFTTRGSKSFRIVSEDLYVYFKQINLAIQAYEDVIITLSVPSSVQVNVSINIDGTVIGEVSGPIEGLDIYLQVNGTEIEADSTDGAGHYYFTLAMTTPGVYSIMVHTPLDDTNYYLESKSEEDLVQITSIPVDLRIVSPMNITYGSIVEVMLMGDAINFWYHIIPVDVSNITWTAPIYRSLPQGNYICNAFAENEYGIISSAISEFQVDTTAPSLYLNNPQNSSYTSNDIKITFFTDADIIRAFFDGNELPNPVSDQYLYDINEGHHNLTIICSDLAGNFIIKRAFFSVDTIPPNLIIESPYHSIFHDGILLNIYSDGSTILYSITGVHMFNQTYLTPFFLNLSIGEYLLSVYAYDEAGNVEHATLEFAIVAKVDLLIESNMQSLDNAGNFYLTTQILPNPNFERLWLEINGSRTEDLEWDAFNKFYALDFSLSSPGIWNARLIAKTIFDEYDFEIFVLNWFPPPPKIEEVYVNWANDHYEIWVKVDDNSLPIEYVKLAFLTSSVDLSYEAFWNRWVTILPINPQNYSFNFSVWYPWDQTPSTCINYQSKWYTPIISVESFSTTRNNFVLEIRVEKQNASIDSVVLAISNGSLQQEVQGDLLYESISGSFQNWRFLVTNLDHSVWTIIINATDIYGATSATFLVFNSTDSPPIFGSHTISLIKIASGRTLYRIEIPIKDDFQIFSVTLYISDLALNPLFHNITHYTFEFWLEEGTYDLQIVAFDDIGQQQTYSLPALTVTIDQSESTSLDSSPISTSSSSVPESIDHPNLLAELGLGGSIFASLVAIGNRINKKRRS